VLRPIRTDDKDRLQRGMKLLSERSRLLRFNRPIRQLSDEQLRYLTEVDHRDHVAWVALDPEHPELPGMGVGRYTACRSPPRWARRPSPSLTGYHGRGLDALLLAVLAETARANGIRVFRNYVRTDNAIMLEVFDQLGATRQRCSTDVYEVDSALPDDPAQLPDTPAGRAIRVFAQRQHQQPELAHRPLAWTSRLSRRSNAHPPPPIDTGPCGREQGMLGGATEQEFFAGSERVAEYLVHRRPSRAARRRAGFRRGRRSR
jgi:GNAT superfamily N-acetyltransferase